jgi:hypothetical protein
MTTAPTGFPLPLRNALAALAIAALDDPGARGALAWLAGGSIDPAPPPAGRPRAHHLVEPDAIDVHARRADAHAARALRADARSASADARRRGRGRAPSRLNERLFFEVHEVLEAEWKRTSGEVRQALQGVIQIAVALHHHAHGNPRGARTLMHEGRGRLAACAPALPSLDTTALLAATAPWEDALVAGTAERDAPPPTIGRRT